MITLISIGLNSHRDLSLRAIEAARAADTVYVENYTMKLDTTIAELVETIGKPIIQLRRGSLEEQAENILAEAKTKNIKR